MRRCNNRLLLKGAYLYALCYSLGGDARSNFPPRVRVPLARRECKRDAKPLPGEGRKCAGVGLVRQKGRGEVGANAAAAERAMSERRTCEILRFAAGTAQKK